jgi:hypothetical protein
MGMEDPARRAKAIFEATTVRVCNDGMAIAEVRAIIIQVGRQAPRLCYCQ